MNQTDRLKDAQKLIEMGIEPDIIMVSQTMDEYAESMGEEVDTFDEDKGYLNALEDEALNIEYELDLARQGLETLNITIDLIQKEIDATERVIETCRNWAQKYELQEDVRDSERDLESYVNRKVGVLATIVKYEARLQDLKTELAEAKETFENKYAR